MSSSNNSDFAGLVLAVGSLLLIIATIASIGWYRAGVQAEVYQRQGVEMTQWECFMNAKPIERMVTIK